MKIENPRIEPQYQTGRPLLVVTIDGIKTIIDSEQNSRRYGIIYLGSSLEGRYSAVVPADPDADRAVDWTIDGATDNPEIVALYDRYRKSMDTKKWAIIRVILMIRKGRAAQPSL